MNACATGLGLSVLMIAPPWFLMFSVVFFIIYKLFLDTLNCAYTDTATGGDHPNGIAFS
jgi:hypothetical protein